MRNSFFPIKFVNPWIKERMNISLNLLSKKKCLSVYFFIIFQIKFKLIKMSSYIILHLTKIPISIRKIILIK